MKLPKTRDENIVVQRLKNEVLLYDLTTHKAYCLNETSTIIYNHCDGETSFDKLKRKYKFTDDLIHFAISELSAENLLEDSQPDNHFGNLSRREVIRKIGLASMVALPIITGLVAPEAAQAQSRSCTPGGVASFPPFTVVGQGGLCMCTNVGVGNTCGSGAGIQICKSGCICRANSCSIDTCTGICE